MKDPFSIQEDEIEQEYISDLSEAFSSNTFSSANLYSNGFYDSFDNSRLPSDVSDNQSNGNVKQHKNDILKKISQLKKRVQKDEESEGKEKKRKIKHHKKQ